MFMGGAGKSPLRVPVPFLGLPEQVRHIKT